jgi:hypothetical protein
MDDQARILDQAEDEILAPATSDEAVEAAAGTERAALSCGGGGSFCGGPTQIC